MVRERSVETPCESFRLLYPQIVAGASDGVKQRINSAILARVQPEGVPPDFETQAFFAEAKSKRPRNEPWFRRRGADVLANTGVYLTVLFLNDAFTGSPEAVSSRAYTTFRIADGSEVRLEQLIAAESMPRLVELARMRFAERGNAPEAPDGETHGPTCHWADGVKEPSAFAAVPQGLLLRWEAGAIAEPACGAAELVLPWKAVAPLLRPDAGIAPLLPR